MRKNLTIMLLFFYCVINSQPLNNWLEFDGVNEFVNIPDNAALDLTNNYTIEAWIFPKSFTFLGGIVSKYHTAASNGYTLTLNLNSPYTGIQFDGVYTDNGILTDDNWYHIAAVNDNGTRKIYVNGVSRSVYGTPHSTAVNTDAVAIGVDFGQTDARFFNGHIDDVRIWNDVRTQQEIQDNMFTDVSTSEANLVAYWKLNESSGTSAPDCKGGYNGTLSNMEDDDWVPILEPVSHSIKKLTLGSAAWADFDNDGDLDIVICGEEDDGSTLSTEIYYNNSGTFSLQASLEGIYFGSVDCGDYNNDGFLDLLFTGTTTNWQNETETSVIYKNNGDGSFTKQTNISLTGVFRSSGSWADYDNDGDLDIILCGSSQDGIEGITTIFYKNNGDGSFTEQTGMDLPDVYISHTDWGDYDRDGDLDIVICGQDRNGDPISKICNTGSDNLFTQTSFPITGVENGSSVWGDYDNDGYLDIFVNGGDEYTYHSKIYRNNSGTAFITQADITPTPLYYGSGYWSDYNNDGYSDLLIMGIDGAECLSKIYKNIGNNTFIEQTEISLTGIKGTYVGEGIWGDYDNDGDLDLLLTGDDYSGDPVVALYRNNSLNPNTAPGTPTSLQAVDGGNSISKRLQWNKSSDSQTPVDGLTYNIRVGSYSGGCDIVNPMADISTGFRKIPKMGNAHNNFWTIEYLPDGTYYWSVQAIDGAFGGSAFAAEQTFTISSDLNSEFQEKTDLPTSIEYSSADWGDFDNDGDMDLAVCGYYSSSGRLTKIYRNSDNSFTDSGISFPGVYDGDVKWGDYNNDGYPDLVVTGKAQEGYISKIYKNNQNSTFSEDVVLNGLAYSCAAWGDYNNDGSPDLFMAGYSSSESQSVSEIYMNNTDGTFTEVENSIPGLRYAAAEWGDYNNDGDLDLIVSGYAISGRITRIYDNDNGSFSESGISLPGLSNGSATWGDYDCDGDLDILLTGIYGSGSEYKTCIYKNLGSGDGWDFEQFIQNNLETVGYSSACWIDFNNDGLLDIVLSGESFSTAAPTTRIYFNLGESNGYEFYEDTGHIFDDVKYGCCVSGDFDNDNDLDLFISGEKASGRCATIFENTFSIVNDNPETPTGLSASLDGTTATFTWNAASDDETPSAGLTYNLRIGTTSGGDEIMPAMADISSGYRKIARLGNTNHNTSWSVSGLPEGHTYYWSVQSIDNSFAGSEFAVEQSFYVTDPGQKTMPGYTLDFDGENDYVECGNDESLTEFNDFTMEAWIWLENSGNNQKILGKFKDWDNYYIMGVGSGVQYSQISANGESIDFSAGNVPSQQWTHLAVTFSKGNGGNNGAFYGYVNGEIVYSKTDVTDNALSVSSGSFPFRIGTAPWDITAFLVDGKIDEVRIWNVARTESQIREDLYNTLSGSETGLKAYWQFNEISGSSTALEHLSGNDGTLQNMNVNDVWVSSTLPTGGGLSCSCESFSGGTEIMGNISLTTTDGFDNPVDLLCTEIENSPNTTSGISGDIIDRYFVLSAFGTPGTFSTNLTFTLPEGNISAEDQATPSNLKLYRRESNSDGNWTLIASGASATSTTATFNEVTSFSQFIISSDAPLPVELTTFEADVENDMVNLNWQTATEVDNYGFEIERALSTTESARTSGGEGAENSGQTSTSEEWENIGFVEGSGNSNSPKYYSFVDKPFGGSSFKYRLKQIDTDGSFIYSDEVNVTFLPREFSLKQNYPNPFNPSTTVEYSVPSKSRVKLELFDILGRRVKLMADEIMNEGNYQVTIDASDYTSGIYILRACVKEIDGSRFDYRTIKMTLLK